MSPPRGTPAWPPDLVAEPAPSRAGAVWFGLAVAALALWDLGGRSLFHRDLPRFAVIAREMLQSGDWLVPHQHGETYANKPILYVWLVALPSALVGDPTAFLLRLPSALGLVLLALATSAWGRARTGSAAVGRLAGLLAVTTMLTNELGRVGRPDLLATAFGTAAAMLLDRASLGRGARSDPWVAGLLLGASHLTKGPVGLVVAAAVLVLPDPAVPWRERLRRARPLLALGVSLLVAAAWIVPAWLREGGDFVRRLAFDQVAERVAGRGNHREAWFYYLVELPQVWLPWSPVLVGALLACASRRVRERLVVGPLPAVVAVTLLVFSCVPTKEVRYASVVVPPLAVVAAAAVRALLLRAADPRRAARHLLAGGVAAVVAGCAMGAAGAWWPSSLPWVLPPALLAVATGVAAGVRARRGGEAAPALAGRAVGVAVVVVACGFAAYWGVLARYLVVNGVRENAAVAAVLPAGVPTVLVVARGLEPDDLYDAVRRPVPVRRGDAVPSRAALRDAVVLCDAGEREAVERARGGALSVLLERPRARGGTLLVLR